MENRESTFIITREDRGIDPATLSAQALRIGRMIDCEIVLNHPTVSRLHAGINEVDGRFYLVNLSSSNSTTINGKLIQFNEVEEIADGDVAQIGPFFLRMSRTGKALGINVLLQIAVNIGEAEARAAPDDEDQLSMAETISGVASPKVADALKSFWDKRTRDKAARPSLLHPKRPPRPGKARFNWMPTRDLARPWPVSVFIWAIIATAALTAAAALWYASAFSPAPLSQPHARAGLVHSGPAAAIAKQPNANSCTTCHTVSARMETNCASCHQTEAFDASLTGIRAHTEAGIGCATCHAEHQGADFRPAASALNQCATCHRDDNKSLYRGRRVFTPHGGTVGYPVVNGKWKWEGPDDEAWRQKPDASNDSLKRARERLTGETEDQWRSRQFHALHVYRVLVAPVGLAGNEGGEMSCSSCHRSFNPIDRVTPATTCARCHNNDNREVESNGQQRTLVDSSAPNCSSCHIQHVKEPGHWNPKLLASHRDAQKRP
ncbi:MAG: FHA domain-containing protein [Pyrinomonadaceae bacterium]